MAHLLAVVQLRQPFAPHYRHLNRQRGWWVELDRRRTPPQTADPPRPTCRGVKRRGKEFLAPLEQHARDWPQAARVVAHLAATCRHRWRRLFQCDAWPQRYRTNHDLETCLGRRRPRQRQIQGHKSVPEFVLRSGEGAVFIDAPESYEQRWQRFEQFDQAKFDQEQARFLKAQQRLQVLHRFRHRPRRCLKDREQQWAEAVRRKH